MMKRKNLNYIILATYLALVCVLFVGIISVTGAMINAPKDNSGDENGEFKASEIMINDEISVYVGQETVLSPYLMNIDGTIETARFEYSSSNPAVTVDNYGKLVANSAPEGDCYITIRNKTTSKTVKVNVISSLEHVIGIVNSNGNLVDKGTQAYVTGKSYRLTVNTEPAGADISKLCTVTITNQSGSEKRAFEVAYERNQIILTPVGIGTGFVEIEIKNTDGETLYSVKYNFSIQLESASLTNEILEQGESTLMVGSDFNKITSLTITSEMGITDMATLSILKNLKEIKLDSYSVIQFENINSDITYHVPYDVYSAYTANEMWQNNIINLLPYSRYDENVFYIVYHNTRDNVSTVEEINSYMYFPEYSAYEGQKHSGWADQDGKKLNLTDVKQSRRSIHAYSVWEPISFKIVYHLRLYDITFEEMWVYDGERILKQVDTFEGYAPKSGHDFIGWSMSEYSNMYDGGFDFISNASFLDINAYDGGEIHLYDIWHMYQYYINFRVEGDYSYGFNGYDYITVTGESYELPRLEIYTNGYKFMCWIAPDGTELKPGQNTYGFDVTDGETVTLTAKIIEVSYIIMLNLNGGECNDADGNPITDHQTITLDYNEEFVLPVVYKAGANFRGWQIGVNGPIYSGGDIIKQLANDVALIQITAIFD